MLVSVATALILAAGTQLGPEVRARAEQLAREGRAVEAIELFEQVVEQNPADTEARLWIGRLDLRLGRTEHAEAIFRSVLHDHPADVDAKIGFAGALIRRGAPDEALTILDGAERDAGQNADLFATMGRAYRRVGDDRRALEYFKRAMRIAPDDPDVVSGFEAVAFAYGHSIAFAGFTEHIPGATTSSGALTGSIRVMPRLRVDGFARLERRSGSSDTLLGAGVIWRVGRSTNLAFHALGGPDNTILATSDIYGDLINYAGQYELGVGVRRLTFEGVDVAAVSSTFAWDAGRWRLDSRYTYSRSRFDNTNEATGDHSVLLRETWRGWRRASLNAAYAHGIESFEDLTADRIALLGSTTVAVGARFNLPSLTMITTTWEHQWRSNATALDRFTVGIVQSFP